MFDGKKRLLSGRSSYSEVERLIMNGRELCIVSPYIDSYYARLLSRNSGGKRVFILSSSIDKEAAKLIGRRFSLSKFVLFLALMAVELYIGAGLGNYILAMAATLATLGAGILLSWTGSGISLRIPKRFVHAKMYISESRAITGSANLTYRGMHSNVEMIEVIDDRETVERMKRMFWKMWKEYS